MCIEPIDPQIAKLSRNLRTCWYQIKKNWYILGFGTKTNILTPLSLYPLSPPPWDSIEAFPHSTDVGYPPDVLNNLHRVISVLASSLFSLLYESQQRGSKKNSLSFRSGLTWDFCRAHNLVSFTNISRKEIQKSLTLYDFHQAYLEARDSPLFAKGWNIRCIQGSCPFLAYPTKTNFSRLWTQKPLINCSDVSNFPC